MKEKILHYFRDINYVYNDATKYDKLQAMLEEMEQEKCGSCIIKTVTELCQQKEGD